MKVPFTCSVHPFIFSLEHRQTLRLEDSVSICFLPHTLWLVHVVYTDAVYCPKARPRLVLVSDRRSRSVRSGFLQCVVIPEQVTLFGPVCKKKIKIYIYIYTRNFIPIVTVEQFILFHHFCLFFSIITHLSGTCLATFRFNMCFQYEQVETFQKQFSHLHLLWRLMFWLQPPRNHKMQSALIIWARVMIMTVIAVIINCVCRLGTFIVFIEL